MNERETEASKEFLKAGVSGGGLTAGRFLCGFVRAKWGAVILGASGVGFLAQGTQFQTLGMTMGALAMAAGLVNKVSAWDRRGRLAALETALTLHLVASGLVVVIGALFSAPLAALVWGQGSVTPTWIVIVLIGIPFAALAGSYLEATLFGLGRYDLYNRASLQAAVLSLALFLALTKLAGLRGALLSVGLSPVILFCLFLWAVKTVKPRPSLFRLGWDRAVSKELLGYGTTMLITSCATTSVLLSLRSLLIAYHGARANGIYQVPVALSAYYTPFLTSALWARLQPAVSRSDQGENALIELEVAWRWTLLASTAFLLTLQVAPEIVVWVAYSREFEHATPLIPLQAVADFLALVSAVFGTFLLASGRLKRYLAVFLGDQALFAAIGFAVVRSHGATGLVYASIASLLPAGVIAVTWYVRTVGVTRAAPLLSLLAKCALAVGTQALVVNHVEGVAHRFIVPVVWLLFSIPSRERSILKHALAKL